MTTKQFNELQRQADVIEEAAKQKIVNEAMDLYIETVPLETTDIDTEPEKWHQLYLQECKLFDLLRKMDWAQGEEYRHRVRIYNIDHGISNKNPWNKDQF
jgi:hypothetical protein